MTASTAIPPIGPQHAKINLMGLSRLQMEQFFLDLGEKKFRAHQILKWIHHAGITQIEEMSNLGKALREKLMEVAEVRPPEIVSQQDSSDGTRKWAIRVEGGGLVETVLIPAGNRATLCVSSQVGCALDCSFCSTGKQGFQRDLSAAEIIGQVWLAIKSYDGFKPGDRRIVTNVVMMGMGEPLLNFDNVVAAMDLMLEDLAYGLSKRRVTLSTSGVVPALDRLSEVSEVSLAVSLHAPNDELRSQIMPINNKYPIKEVLRSVQGYMDNLSDKRVPVIEYTMIASVNDHRQHARELAVLLEQLPCKINIIPFNPFSLSDYRRPSSSSITNFRQILQKAGYTVTVRTTRGDDIGAACGQLVGDVEDQTRRSERHNRRHAQSELAKKDGSKVFGSTDNLAVAADRL